MTGFCTGRTPRPTTLTQSCSSNRDKGLKTTCHPYWSYCSPDVIPTDLFPIPRAKSELAGLLLSQESFRTSCDCDRVQSKPLEKTSSPKPFGGGWTSAKSTSESAMNRPKKVPKWWTFWNDSYWSIEVRIFFWSHLVHSVICVGAAGKTTICIYLPLLLSAAPSIYCTLFTLSQRIYQNIQLSTNLLIELIWKFFLFY